MYKFPKYIDTHVHLAHPMFKDDVDPVIGRALKNETWIIIVGSDYDSSVRAIEIAEHYPYGVYATAGIHPAIFETEIDTGVKTIDHYVDLEKFRALIRNEKVVAIGEIGLDFHNPHFGNPDHELHRELITHLQYGALNRLLSLANEAGLPLLLHVREAHDEMINFLRKFKAKNQGFELKGVVHHFTGDWRVASQYLNLNFLLSFTSVIVHSFTRQDIIKKIPSDKMTIESECLYLLPETVNLPRPEPMQMIEVVQRIADIKKIPTDKLRGEIVRNNLKVFSRILRTLPN